MKKCVGSGKQCRGHDGMKSVLELVFNNISLQKVQKRIENNDDASGGNKSASRIQIKSKLQERNDYIIVPDSHPLFPNRYFVGFTLHGVYTSMKTIGAFVYFDSSGRVQKVCPIGETLITYDWRDGRVDTYLYDRNLVFAQCHRDLGTYNLTVNQFDQEDRIQRESFIRTDIEDDDNWRPDKPDNLHPSGKYAQLTSSNWLDLSSFKVNEGDADYKNCSIDVYETSDPSTLDSTIAPLEPSDGYPAKCIICSETTSRATWEIDSRSFISLGGSFCTKCEIRYSLSEERWVCCKHVGDNRMCNKTVVDGQPCTCEGHASTPTLILNQFAEEDLKYPFRKGYYVRTKDYNNKKK